MHKPQLIDSKPSYQTTTHSNNDDKLIHSLKCFSSLPEKLVDVWVILSGVCPFL